MYVDIISVTKDKGNVFTVECREVSGLGACDRIIVVNVGANWARIHIPLGIISPEEGTNDLQPLPERDEFVISIGPGKGVSEYVYIDGFGMSVSSVDQGLIARLAASILAQILTADLENHADRNVFREDIDDLRGRILTVLGILAGVKPSEEKEEVREG